MPQQEAMVVVHRDSMSGREMFGSLRERGRVRYEMVRDAKRRSRKVSGRALSGEYQVKLVFSFKNMGEGESKRAKEDREGN